VSGGKDSTLTLPGDSSKNNASHSHPPVPDRELFESGHPKIMFFSTVRVLFNHFEYIIKEQPRGSDLRLRRPSRRSFLKACSSVPDYDEVCHFVGHREAGHLGHGRRATQNPESICFESGWLLLIALSSLENARSEIAKWDAVPLPDIRFYGAIISILNEALRTWEDTIGTDAFHREALGPPQYRLKLFRWTLETLLAVASLICPSGLLPQLKEHALHLNVEDWDRQLCWDHERTYKRMYREEAAKYHPALDEYQLWKSGEASPRYVFFFFFGLLKKKEPCILVMTDLS
jgi:hypothetical protein